jgi:hypothetical protein
MNVDGDAILLSRAANAILGMLRIMSPYFVRDAPRFADIGRHKL